MELLKEVPALVCINCQTNPVPEGRRKYCALCGSQASLIWKRLQRQSWRETGQPYWLDNWKNATPAKMRKYFREYMRLYRLRNRHDSPLAKSERDRSVAEGR
jgi:hypothetical protein